MQSRRDRRGKIVQPNQVKRSRLEGFGTAPGGKGVSGMNAEGSCCY